MAKPKTSKPKRTASEIGKGSRRKGAAYEREIANALKDVYPNSRRGIGQTRNAGEVPDVDGTPFWIEAKHHKRVNIRKAYLQAVAAIESTFAPAKNPTATWGAVRPVLVVSRDTGVAPDLVTMAFSRFYALLHELELLRKAFDEKVG